MADMLSELAQTAKIKRSVSRVKRGKSFDISLSFSGLDDIAIAKLEETLGEDRNLRSLSLNGNKIGEHCARAIARILGHCPSITALDLTRNPLGPEGVKIILDAAKDHPSLRSIKLKDTHLGAGAGKIIGEFVQGNRLLTSLDIRDNKLNDEDATAIAQGLSSNSSLQDFECFYNRFTAEGRATLLDALLNVPTLVHCSLAQYDDLAEGESEKISAKVQEAAPRNLFSFTPYDPDISILGTHNRKAAITLLPLMGGKPSQLSPLELGRVLDHLPLIHRHAYESDYKKHSLSKQKTELDFTHFVRSLPFVTRASEQTMDAFFKPGSHGYSPIDNPKNWRDVESLFSAMEAAGGMVDEALLARRTERGSSLLEAAACFARMPELLASLHKRDLRLQGDNLLTETGKPSAGYNALIERGQAHHLFTEENWKGASRSELQAVIRHLPPEASEKIPNRHKLMASVPAGHTQRQVGG